VLAAPFSLGEVDSVQIIESWPITRFVVPKDRFTAKSSDGLSALQASA